MTAAFGSLFNDINIERTDSSNTVTHLLKVPIIFSSKDKLLSRTDSDPEAEFERETALSLPMLAFDYVGDEYDAERELQRINFRSKEISSDVNKFYKMYQEVPYNFEYNLHIISKTIEDNMKIYEQIIPFFAPSWTIEIYFIPSMGIKADVPIVRNSVSYEDNVVGPFEGSDSRAIVRTLNFTMKGRHFCPIVKKPIIKFANNNLYVGNTTTSNSDPDGRFTVSPGQDANGAATTNAAISVAANTIFVDDNWDYIVTSSGIIINE